MNDNRGNGPAVTGCGVLILFAVALWAFLWALKIGMILLGVAMILTAFVGAIALPIYLWSGVRGRRAAEENLAELDAALVTLSNESSGRLRTAVRWWDDLQRNKGVGTRLEEAYFVENSRPLDAELRDILVRANTLAEESDRVLQSATTTFPSTAGHTPSPTAGHTPSPGAAVPTGEDSQATPREECIDQIERSDDLTLELDALRRKVSTG